MKLLSVACSHLSALALEFASKDKSHLMCYCSSTDMENAIAWILGLAQTPGSKCGTLHVGPAVLQKQGWRQEPPKQGCLNNPILNNPLQTA